MPRHDTITMSSAKEANLSVLYSELNKFGQKGEYERALKTANKLLQQFPEETKAYHCKVTCLIQLSKFSEASQLINKISKLGSDLTFEKAYCLYRLNQPQDALKVVDTEAQPSLKLKELKAQILYRLEKFEECFDVYRYIIKNSEDEYEDERETNLAAVLANMYIEGTERELPALRETTYELVYNTATQLIGQGFYAEAEKKLRLAEKMCKEMLEEDGATEEDIEEETGIIKVQLAYCLQQQGQEKEAQAIYTAALKRKPDDISLVAIASNNSVTVNRDQNVFDSKKKMRATIADKLEHKLTSRQRRSIALNHCLLLLYTSQGEECQKRCEQLGKDYPELTAETTLIRATQLAREGRCKEAAGLLEEASKTLKDKQIDMRLASVQLLLAEGDRKEACRILHNLGETTFRPGIVSALVTLYLADDNREGASNVLKDAVDWFRKNKENQGDLSLMWRKAADFHLRGGQPAVAAKSLEELLKLNPDSKKTLAQLVLAYAQFDPPKATALSKKLPELAYEGQDVDALETSNWIMGTKVIKKAEKSKVEPSPGSKAGTPGSELLQQKLKKKKKKKGKLPKPYESGNLPEPDPRRWLPRHERLGYRKKKDRRNKDASVGKGTQGSATGSSDMYDITKMPSQAKPSPVASSPAVEPGPRQQHRRVQHKKKKKGGKW